MNSELYLGQPERKPLVRDADPVAAGEGQFEPASQREPVDRGDRRAGQRFESIERPLPGTDQTIGGLGIRKPCEFLDIGPCDEAALLAGDEDDAGWRIACQLPEDGVELHQHAGREDVGRRAWLVECEPGDSVGITFADPRRGLVHEL